jgi:hypothetical protein
MATVYPLVQGQAGVFEPSPLKNFNESVGPAPPGHDRDGVDHDSFAIFRRFIAEKEGTLMNLWLSADSSLARLPPTIMS